MKSCINLNLIDPMIIPEKHKQQMQFEQYDCQSLENGENNCKF